MNIRMPGDTGLKINDSIIMCLHAGVLLFFVTFNAVPVYAATALPVVTLAITNGSQNNSSSMLYTKSPRVNLSLSTTDTSNIAGMCISNTETCTKWTRFVPEKKWTLSKGDGAKTVRVWFKDSYGNVSSSPSTANVTLKTKSPILTIDDVPKPIVPGDLTISGSVEEDASVQVSAKATTETATVSGTAWSYKILGLTKGNNKVTVTVTDVAGNMVKRVIHIKCVAAPIKHLNDTGVTACGRRVYEDIQCPDPNYPGQDAEFGRDVKFNNNSDGDSGFSFTKLDLNGIPLAASAESWSCVRDNVTGLVWESKTSDGGLMDKSNTYTWYKPDTTYNGGSAGTQNGGTCSGDILCDTTSYVQAINSLKLCSSTEWRLPTVNELLSIAHYWKNPGMPVEFPYFPDQAQQLWSDNIHPYSSSTAWTVFFKWGSWATPADKSTAIPLRLVSGRILAGPYDNNKFKDNQNGTVTDTQTGLIWMRCMVGLMWDGQSCVNDNIEGDGCGGDGWNRVLNSAKCLNASGGFAGHRDWHIPNIKELASIVNWESEQYFSSDIFPNIPPYTPFWSSTPNAYTLGGVWVIETGNAEMRTIGRGGSGLGLLVRDGQ